MYYCLKKLICWMLMKRIFSYLSINIVLWLQDNNTPARTCTLSWHPVWHVHVHVPLRSMQLIMNMMKKQQQYDFNAITFSCRNHVPFRLFLMWKIRIKFTRICLCISELILNLYIVKILIIQEYNMHISLRYNW